MEAIEQIKQMPLSKNKVIEFSESIKAELECGNIDPLELALYFKSMEEIVKNVKTTLNEMAVEEAQKYGKSFQFKGAKIDVREMGTKYDYSECGDIHLQKISQEIDASNEKRKERENILKALKEPLIAIDDETGETFTMYPPKKSSTTGIAISFVNVK